MKAVFESAVRECCSSATLTLALLFSPARLDAQQVTQPVPELHTTARLTFEPSPEDKDTFLAFSVDCLGHNVRFVRKPEDASSRIPPRNSKFGDTGMLSSVAGLTPAASRLFFTTTGPRTLLFLISRGWASEAAALYVVGFHPDGTPYRVLAMDEFDPASIQTGPGSDVRIIGKASLSQIEAGEGFEGDRKPYATTYDPFSVYVVHGDASALYSLAESKSYNRLHYVWAGAKTREDYAVVYNLPGHSRPFGAMVPRAVHLVETAGKAGQRHP